MSGIQTDVPPTSVDHDGEAVVVRIPPDPRYLRVVRMVAATIAADAGFSIDEIEDVRMAAGEVCAAILEQELAEPVVVTVRCSDGTIALRAESVARETDSAVAPPVDELRGAILGAVTDAYATTVLDGQLAATFTKAGAAER